MAVRTKFQGTAVILDGSTSGTVTLQPIAVAGTQIHYSPEPYAGIYISAGATTQTTNGTPGTFDTMTGFAAAGGANGSVYGMTADKANNKIVALVAGIYEVTFNVSFSGTGSETYLCELYNSTTATASVPGKLERKLGAAGDVGSAAFSCFVTAAANDEFVIRVTCSSGASKNFIPSYANFRMRRVSS